MRIGRPGFLVGGGGGGTRRRLCSAAGDRRSAAILGFPCSISTRLRSRRDYAPCVVHPWPNRDTRRLGSGRAATSAAFRGGARRSAAARWSWWSTGHGLGRKDIRETGQTVPRAQRGRRGGAGRTSARTGGEGGAELVAGVEEGASGRLGGAGRRIVLLRSRWGDQRERSGTSGKQS